MSDNQLSLQRASPQQASRKTPKWTIVIPTYRRQDILQLALEHIQNQKVDLNDLEVLVYDNGSTNDSRSIAEAFNRSLRLHYSLNEPGHGLGYSLRRGASEAKGEIIIELNDDALIPPDFLTKIETVFQSDPEIGVVGVRAIEQEYESDTRPIGIIDSASTDVTGNFNLPTECIVDVEHVYGFCYAYRRDLIEAGVVHDVVLLSQDYSSGNRIETDHCLSACAAGYRVVYDGSIDVVHLAKPRPDLDETSLNWRANYWRNTFYLYLKHFGWFGRQAIAPRFALKDLGLLSLINRPNKTNWLYFWTGIKARSNAVFCWMKWQWIKLRNINRTSTIRKTNQT